MGRMYSVAVLFLMTLLGFQNCGVPKDQLRSARYLKSKPESNGPLDFLNGEMTDPIKNTNGASFLPKQILVKMKTEDSNAIFSNWASNKGLNLMNDWKKTRITHWKWEGDLDVVQFQELLIAEPFAAQLDWAEPNYVFSRPNPMGGIETLSSSVAAGTGKRQTEAAIGLDETRANLSDGREPVVVAVIDSGIEINHPVFHKSAAIWTNPKEIPGDGIDNDGNGFVDDVTGWNFPGNNNNPQDDDGHGTHCAGIVLGVEQDIFADSLTSSRIKIMALKFIGADGSGSTSDAINAIYYAVDNGAQVLSNSWGGGGESKALRDAIAYANNKGTSFIAAAGNDSKNNDSKPTFPANYLLPNVISVAATDDSDNIARFSNFGKDTVTLAAPGVRILSTYPGGGFAYLSGTSMATPFVAGAAALMFYENPRINGQEIKQVLEGEADIVPNLVELVKNEVRLDVAASVTLASRGSFGGQIIPVETTSRRELASAKARQGESSSGGGGCGAIFVVSSGGGAGKGGGMSLALLLLPLLYFVYSRQRFSRTQIQ